MRIIWLGHAGFRIEIAGGAGDRTAGVAADHPVTGREDGRIAHPTYGQVPHGWAAGRCPTSAQVPIPASVSGHADVALQMRRQGMAQHWTGAPLSHQGGRQGQNNPHQPMTRDQRMQGVHGPQRVCGDQSSHDIHSTSRPIGVGPGPLGVGGAAGRRKPVPGAFGRTGKPALGRGGDQVRSSDQMADGQGCSGPKTARGGDKCKHDQPSFCVFGCRLDTRIRDFSKPENCIRYMFLRGYAGAGKF